MTAPREGADPGAHGRRHRAPRRGDDRHDRPARSNQRQDDTPVRSNQRQDPGPPSGTGDGASRAPHPVVAFFRANPQVLVLLIVCLVLGIGTFLAVLFGLVTAGSDQTTGEPSGAILGAHTVVASARWLIV